MTVRARGNTILSNNAVQMYIVASVRSKKSWDESRAMSFSALRAELQAVKMDPFFPGNPCHRVLT